MDDTDILSDNQIAAIIEAVLRANAPEPVSEDTLIEVVHLFTVERILHELVLNGELDVTVRNGQLTYVKRTAPFKNDSCWLLLSEEPMPDSINLVVQDNLTQTKQLEV